MAEMAKETKSVEDILSSMMLRPLTKGSVRKVVSKLVEIGQKQFSLLLAGLLFRFRGDEDGRKFIISAIGKMNLTVLKARK